MPLQTALTQHFQQGRQSFKAIFLVLFKKRDLSQCLVTTDRQTYKVIPIEPPPHLVV